MEKLLLVEDEEITGKLISGLLQQIGYTRDQILWRCSISQLGAINCEDISVVITDLTLPDSTYLNTFDEIRKLFPGKPIVVLTGAGQKELALKTIQHGAQDYLEKGEISKKMLSKSIQYAIERNNILESIFVEKQNLRATINNTKDIIWSVSKNFKIISANNAFWHRLNILTGKAKHEVTEMDFDKERFDTWIQYYDRALKDEAYKIVWEEELNGKTVFEEVSFNPIHDKDNKVIGVSCFSRDISEQQHHLNMIEKQNEQLRKIAWVQSHEVRSPVTTILGLLQLYNHENTADPENVDILKYLQAAAENLDMITRKINDYTQMQGK